MDLEKVKQQLQRDWEALLREYNSDPFGSQVPEKFVKAYRILYSVWVLGYSYRKVGKYIGITHSKIKEKYVDRYLSTYQKYALLGEIPESVNILKEAFDRKAGRPRKDYEELARQLKEGNPLLWDRLIKGITSYRVRGNDEKPIFLSKEKLRKLYGEEVEKFLGVRVNQKTLWAKFVDEIVRLEFGGWARLYAKVLPYKLYMKYVESERAKYRKLPPALGFGWEYVLDITEVAPDGENATHYVLAALDTYSGLILGWRIKPKEKGKSYNDAFDRYDVGLFLKEIFERWGIPKGIKIDNGKNFLAEYVQEALELLGVEVYRSQAYAGWQKPIERVFGEIKEWLLTPGVQELSNPIERIGKAFEFYNSTKRKSYETSYTTEIENKEEVFNFAFLYKALRKVNNGYISIEGVRFFVGHLIAELEDSKRLGRGRKRAVNELLVAVHPENLTKAWIYIPSEDGGFPYEGRKWKLLGVVNAETLLPADERTLTQKAKKVRKKRTLKRKAEKLYQKLNKVQSELIEEETKPAKDEFDQFLTPEEPELPTYSEEELLPPKEVLENEPLEVPIFRSPVHALKWLQEHQHDLHRIKPADLKRLAKGLSQIRVSSLPPAKREFFEQIKAKIQKEVMSHA